MVQNNIEANFQKIVFPHITKTGGNSLVALFQGSYPIESILPSPPQLTIDEIDLLEANFDNLRFIHGHPGTNLSYWLPVENNSWITIIRDPISRYVSEYLYARNDQSTHHHKIAKNLTIVEFSKAVCGIDGNYQTRQLAVSLGYLRHYTDNLSEEIALKVVNSLKKFDFLCVTERLNESLDLLSSHFGLTYFDELHKNPTNTNSDEQNSCAEKLYKDNWAQRDYWDYYLLHISNSFLNKKNRRNKIESYINAESLNNNRSAIESEDGSSKALLFEGWYPQEWESDYPSSINSYWWCGRNASFLIQKNNSFDVEISFLVINTMGFTHTEITFKINSIYIDPQWILEGDRWRAIVILKNDFFREKNHYAILETNGSRFISFYVTDHKSFDLREKSFAIADIRIKNKSSTLFEMASS